jgi:hypothetical protein
VHTDTVYTRDHQSTEAVLVLRSVSTFENLYLSRSTTRMNEAMSSAFASRGQAPGPGEGVTIARTITNELDSARFDPLLVRTVARNAVRVLEGLIAKVDGMVSAQSFWAGLMAACEGLHIDFANRAKRDAGAGDEWSARWVSLPLPVQLALYRDRIPGQGVGDDAQDHCGKSSRKASDACFAHRSSYRRCAQRTPKSPPRSMARCDANLARSSTASTASISPSLSTP